MPEPPRSDGRGTGAINVNPDALLARLRHVVGEAGVLTGPGLEAHEVDWRKRYHGRALAVVRPSTPGEVAAVVRACRDHATPIVPQGGHTGLVGGGTPDASGRQVVLHLGRLNRVRAVDESNLSMTVEAGCVLQSVQEAAAAHGLLFPLSLAAEGSCTIGGNLATNAGGTQVLRYGNARELCLGLEVVTASGEVWDGLGGLRKDNTGYSLRDLFIGSEGTLGVITAAVLKLVPRPRAQLTALAAVPDLDGAVQLLRTAAARCGPALTAFEVMNPLSLDLVARHVPGLASPWRGIDLPEPAWSVLLEVSDSDDEAHAMSMLESTLGDALERGNAVEALVADSVARSRAFWHLREAIPMAQAAEGLNIKHDISLPVSRIPAFVSATDEALQRVSRGARMVTFGHLGDGNLHYNVQAPEGTDPAAFLAAFEPAVNACVYDAVEAHGGSISAEHGIGVLKREELERRKPVVAMTLMRSIKRALDPDDLFNPGRLL
ncbi:MAG: FAD-binding oxidoreductase [Ideonella sp.]|nr:FAD-binding oxidoreductase [Ideonella sp.]